MELWRRVWREGLAGQLSTPGLQALAQALALDDRRIVQKMTTNLPAENRCKNMKVEATCVLGFCGWQGEGLKHQGQVLAYFEKLCRTADEIMGEPAICNHFLSWYDETPRSLMRLQLLAEVHRALNQRLVAAA